MAQTKSKKSKKIIKSLKLNGKNRYIAVALIFALVGGIYFVYRSFAATTVATIEAENMTFAATGPVVVSDSAAGSGKAVKLTSNVAITGTFTSQIEATSISVRAKGTVCGSAPQVTVSVDGKSVLTATVSATSYTNYKVTTPIPAGSHTVKTVFSNPYKTRKCTRTLYVDSVSVINDNVSPVTADTTVPSVSITSPGSAATVSGVTNVTANATDNVAVSKVEFFVDNVLKSTVTASPYNYSWDTIAMVNGNHTLYAIAYDAAGNKTQSSTTTVSVSNVTTADPVPYNVSGNWTLKFGDDFNGTKLDLTKWRPNWLAGTDTAITKPINSAEVSCFDPSQVSVGGGLLTISAVTRPCLANNGITYNYASGIIQSYNHYQFTYGYMEARMWIAPGTGAGQNWPAFWADGTGTWPTTGELDVMELLGGNLCYHFHSPAGGPGGCDKTIPATGWHTFGANWQPGVVTYYYDGKQVGQISSNITSSPMFLIANLGLSPTSGTPPVVTPSSMQVDYIRVWQ